MPRVALVHIEDAFQPPEDQNPELVAVWEDGERVWGKLTGAREYDDVDRLLDAFDGPTLFAFREANAPVDVPEDFDDLPDPEF